MKKICIAKIYAKKKKSNWGNHLKFITEKGLMIVFSKEVVQIVKKMFLKTSEKMLNLICSKRNANENYTTIFTCCLRTEQQYDDTMLARVLGAES